MVKRTNKMPVKQVGNSTDVSRYVTKLVREPIVSVVNDAREGLAPARFSDLISWIDRQPSWAKTVLPRKNISDWSEFDQGCVLQRAPLRRELSWATAYLERHVNDLRAIGRLRREFSAHILDGEFQNAMSILDQIEVKFGRSLWLISARIYALQQASGLDEQKRYASDIVVRSEFGYAGAYAYLVSVRNEPSVSWSRFQRVCSDFLRDQDFATIVDVHFRFHFLPGTSYDDPVLEDILRMEATMSLLDYYDTSMRATMICMDRVDGHFDRVFERMTDIAVQAGDSRMSSQWWCRRPNPIPANPATLPSNNLLELYDRWLRGSLIDPTAHVRQLGVLRRFDELLLAAHVEATQASQDDSVEHPPTKHTVGSRVASKLAQIIARAPEATVAAADLRKLAANVPGIYWSGALQAFLEGELSPHPFGTDPSIQRATGCSMGSLHPIIITRLPDTQLIAECIQSLSAFETRGLWLSVLDSIVNGQGELPARDELSVGARAVISSQIAFRQRDFIKAANYGSQLYSLFEHTGGYYAFQGLRIAVNAYIDCGEYTKAIRLATHATAIHEHLLNSLPMEHLALVLAQDRELRNTLASDLTLSIFIDLYSRHVNRRTLDEHRIASFQDALDAAGVQQASDLANTNVQYNLPELIYFLKNVCTDSVVELTGRFSSTEEVVEERLRICRLLLELDSLHGEEYRQEIQSIVQSRIISAGIRKLEQSKIYIDRVSIRQSARYSLREGFQRYLDLAPTGSKNITHLLERVEKALNKSPSKTVVIAIDSSQAESALLSVVKELRDQYVSNSDSGLDGYLSVHIRHGTLAGQLRSPLVGQQLVTTIDSATGAYNSNGYWPAQLGVQDPDEKDAVIMRLSRFSSDIDATISSLNHEWIRVRREQGDAGMFDFTIDPGDIPLLAHNLGPDCNFDAFLDLAFAMLDSKLERSLSAIRLRLSSELKPRFAQLLGDLERDLEQIVTYDRCRTFRNSARAARTELTTTVDRVVEWFRNSTAQPSESYTIADVIQIAERSVQILDRRFTISMDPMPLDGGTVVAGGLLRHFVSVFFIAFENVVRHSMISGDVSAHVSICQKQGPTYICRIENAVSESVDVVQVRQKLDRIRAEMTNEAHRERVHMEGGTGFHKMRKMLLHDIGCNPNISFEISNERVFAVEFNIHLDEAEVCDRKEHSST